ncbi:MAG: hypothetical protein ACYDHY_07220 [Acidiferrobacterales bacterium]
MYTFESRLKLYVECLCCDRCHLLRLEYDNESGLCLETAPGEPGTTFWSKLKECIAYLFCKRHDVCCNSTYVTKEGAAKIQQWLDAAKAEGYGSDWEPKK